ncbi:MAG: manganese efflux pump [Candidatus Zixiibacteriota bacterium]|nr:MAG: manganese efflux pump [candidate division Zixibacteria bacterium]
MDPTQLILLALALGFDAFAVAVAVGIKMGKLDRWAVFRMSFHFGFAQFGMPLVGWRAGAAVSDLVGSAGIWIAAAILAVIGVRLIWEQWGPEERAWQGDPTRGLSLLVLMFATSVDALAAGLSLALLGSDILYPAVIIGIVAAVMTVVGLVSGRAVGQKFRRTAGLIGGLLLIGLAIKAVTG